MKITFKHPTDRVFILFLVLIVGALIAVLWDYGQKINTLWSQNNANVSYYNSTGAVTLEIKVYIQSALKGLYVDPAVTDPVQSRVYIPEARIYLPLTDLSRNLFYYYQPVENNPKSPAQVSINTGQNINHLANTFADVPCLQRMTSFTINQKGDNPNGDHQVGSIVLSDGRTLYLYDNSSAGCGNFWFPNRTAGDIVSLLKQAQSY